jgi:hypothetical protein
MAMIENSHTQYTITLTILIYFYFEIEDYKNYYFSYAIPLTTNFHHVDASA